MLISFRRTSFASVLLGLALFATVTNAPAQDVKPITPLQKQLDRIDFAISGVGEFTPNSNGNNYLLQSIQLVPSNTLGYMVSLRYIRKPLLGFEFNYGYARYSQNFTLSKSSTTTTPGAFYGVQSNAKEFTGAYVVHTPKTYFGVTPFAAVGAGAIHFQPTIGGGYGLPQQYRAAYFYSVGAEEILLYDHFGVRAQFRQVFHNPPDYLTNYLHMTNQSHTVTTEPSFGVFARF